MISGGGLERLEMAISQDAAYPYVEILEQPASKALRFRYECEGRSAGSIPGANSTPELRTFPTIKIANYNGRGVVVVSCVTKDQPYRPHPHSLVGKGSCKAGVCRVEITPGHSTVSFLNLGIQCVKKKDIADALSIREDIRIDPFRTGFDHKRNPSSVDLNAVRMCFQVFIEGREGKINVPLRPVVTKPIFDKKAMADLMICKMSHYSATVAGGMEMIILCEKVAKDNIQVKFFEKRDGREVWEGYGEFKSIHVHKQVAISFRTPSYRYRQIDEPVPVYVQLRRATDGVTSDPLPFTFLPLGTDDHDYLRRKRQKFEESPQARVLQRVQAEAEKLDNSLNEPSLEYNFDPLKLEVGGESFPDEGANPAFLKGVHSFAGTYRPSVQSPPSPLDDVRVHGDQTLPLPDMNYAAYNVPFVPNRQENVNEQFEILQDNRRCPQQRPLNVLQSQDSQLSSCYQQTHRQQAPMLQKLTLPQQTFCQSIDERDFEGAVVGTDLMDIPGHQQLISDTSLYQLDSEELAAFRTALSETLSSGLSLNDNPVKIENNITSSTNPMSVGAAAASWCGL